MRMTMICKYTARHLRTRPLRSALKSSGCSGFAMSVGWKRMLRRDKYLMWALAEIGQKDGFVCMERNKT